MTPTLPQVHAAVSALLAVAEAIRSLGSVPSGHLYAQVMDRLDLQTYEALIAKLVSTGLVVRDGHLLRWQGKERP